MSDHSDRSDIEQRYRWDLTTIFADTDEWGQAVRSVESSIASLEDDLTVETVSPTVLHDFLDCFQQIRTEMKELFVYSRLRRDLDTGDEKRRADLGEVRQLYDRTTDLSRRLELTLWENPEVLEQLLNDSETRTYDHFLRDTLRQSTHVESTSTVRLRSTLQDVFDSPRRVASAARDRDFDPPIIETSSSEGLPVRKYQNRVKLLKTGSRETRERVHREFYDELDERRHVFATAFRDSLLRDATLAEFRNYDSACEAALDTPVSSLSSPRANVSPSVLTAFLDSMDDALGPLHRFYEAKRESLNLDDLRLWDVRVPFVSTGQPEIPYNRAKEHVLEAMQPLGEDYCSVLRELVESRRVDVYRTENKVESTAYHFGSYATGPYVSLNYDGRFRKSVLRMYLLAHQLGHAMYQELARRNQPPVYGRPQTPLAEIPSYLHELLLTEHLLTAASDSRLVGHALQISQERFRQYFYGVGRNVEFVRRAHRLADDGVELGPDRLDSLCRTLVEKYMGPVSLDDRAGKLWLRKDRYDDPYTDVYDGVDVAVAAAISDRLRNGALSPDLYVSILRAGTSEYPLALLDRIQADPRSTDVVETAATTYDRYLDEITEML